jgi:hypothetical protein
MKKFLILCSLIASLTTDAATTYTISSNSTYSANKLPSQCANCTIKIASGVTLTIDQDIYLQNVSFIGGEKGSAIVVDSKKVTFWSNGSFANVTVTFSGASNMVNSGTIDISNSSFTFSNTSFATVYASINMTSSSWKFINSAYMEATGGTFSLTSSTLTAGDGTASSAAYIKFNGATLSIKDNTSFVTVANSNNYYFNWSNYSTKGSSVKTTDNKMNCGVSGKNACSSPTVYGPSTLSAAGVSSSAILPVKLSAFAVKMSGNVVNITWTTDQEMNSNYFSIERSTNGINWTSIGTVAAQGNTSVATTYAFSDASPVSGTINYRLKMVDMDGSSEYSPIKAVKIAAVETHQMSIYPNPATEYVVISSKGAAVSNVKIQLIGMNGQVLKQMNGGSNVTLSVSEFHAGSYIVRVSDATGAAQNFKLLIAK